MRGALLSSGLGVVLALPSHAAAQGAAAAAAPFPLFTLVSLLGLAITAVAVVAALIAFRRLRRAHALHEDIFGGIPQPRQVVDAEGQTILANKAFYDFFDGVDRPAPELLAAQVGDDEEAREQIERLAEKARQGTWGYTEMPVPGRAGPRGDHGRERNEQTEWRYVAAYPITHHPGWVLWMVDDITLRRQLEQVVKEEQDRFVDLLEHAPIGFYSVDASGRFLFANRTLCNWLGLPPEDLELGEVRLHDVIAGVLPQGTPAHDPFGGRDPAQDVALKGADGNRFEASINQEVVRDTEGRVLRTRSVVRHLSRERAMAEALEHSVQRFARFFQEAPVGIAQFDRDGRITECNNAFSALVGRKSGNLVDVALLDLVHGEDRAAVHSVFVQGGHGAPGARGSPIEVRLGPENETICSMYVTAMVDSADAATGFIAHFIDTTEQKNLEIQFSQSQKMQAVGQLAGGIAHDFNNLLTAMIGFSDLLLLRHRPGDQSFADIMQIKQNANRAANLVRQLLAFSRQQTLQPRVLNVTDILVELSHLLRRLIGENIELEMIHGRDLGVVKADQGQLEQVIINLAVNARDAMAEGGKLTIRTGNVTTERERKHKAEVMPPGDYVLLEVEDTGCGIDPAHLDLIFDPFFSTKDVGQGTGLGLSTVYGIVKQTEGYVFPKSERGRGTSFSIYLPQYVEPVTEVVAAEAESRATRDLTGMGTILLVEDEDAVRLFSARVLRNKGYEVLEATSGESALEVLKKHIDSVDLLVTDVVMPRLDGPSLVRQVRQERPELKVIFISGYTEDAFRKRLGENGDIHFLPKPFSLKQLAAKVKEVLAEEAAAPVSEGTGAPKPASVHS